MPHLRRLTELTEETAHYAVYDHGWAVYVEKVDGSHPVRFYTAVGGRSPAYATATGKALLAWQSEDEIRRVGEEAEGFTPTTHADAEAVVSMAAEVREQGYSINKGEWRAGVWGIAAPVFSSDGSVVAAIGISGPDNRISRDVDHFTQLVRAAASALSASNGYIEQTA
jgi:DNA-binding IclR family transcriptional regulator